MFWLFILSVFSRKAIKPKIKGTTDYDNTAVEFDTNWVLEADGKAITNTVCEKPYFVITPPAGVEGSALDTAIYHLSLRCDTVEELTETPAVTPSTDIKGHLVNQPPAQDESADE
jgi:hypothetical protein